MNFIDIFKDKNKLFLAPLSSVADYPFRLLCREHGAAAVCSEMISAKAVYYNDKKTNQLALLRENEYPVGIQIFGSDAYTMALAAEKMLKYNPSFIDINMGCPVPKVFNNGDGSALLNDIKNAAKIAYEVKKAAGRLPVSAKIRTGIDDSKILAVEIAMALEQSGIDFLTVHGRTRKQMYQGKANLDHIKSVKQAIKIPVIGNGDITDGQSARYMLDYTSCDAVMIGRSSFGNPWIFNEINNYLSNRPFKNPSLEEKFNVIQRHIELICEFNGINVLAEARKHMAWYTKKLPNSTVIRDRINKASSKEEYMSLVYDFFKSLGAAI